MLITNEAERLVTSIGKTIVTYFNQYSLEEIYTVFTNEDFPFDNKLFNKKDIERINSAINGVEKYKILKQIVIEKLNATNNRLEYYYWIVREWGGIINFKKTNNDINDFLKSIKNGKLNSIQIGTISSYSKIISFLEPTDYFIFDSRVAYVLNWLLLKNYNKDNKYFIVPSGRNSDLVKYNIDTIINLYEKNNEKKYYSKKDMYFIYCEFIKLLFQKTKSEIIKEPYYIEMMLFGLFDKICMPEIKTKVKIIIE